MSLITRVLIFIGIATVVAAALSQGVPDVATRFFPDSSNPLQGTLVFYLEADGVERPKLVVRLSQDVERDRLVAEVYDAPAHLNYVPVTVSENVVALDPSLAPSITMEAHGSYWVIDGLPNYNLDIMVRGPIFAMWGLQVSNRFAQVPRESPLATIKVRSDASGLPVWDLRVIEALDHFRGEGIYRVNYAEKKCETPLTLEPTVFAPWPYVSVNNVDYSRVAVGPNFEQRTGFLAPPIVMDWNRGRITTVSEIVTVRDQNCSYSVYAFNEIELGRLNDLNAETPFAFYDLSGLGVGYPNLIIRTEYYPQGDPWSIGIDPEVQQGRPTQIDMVNVRYSWATRVGDGLMDYKLDFIGPQPYTFDTEIAGGMASITAPPYELFPGWVINQTWPAIAFISVEGVNYRSDEGIYSWFGAAELGAYALGLSDTPPQNAFGAEGRGLSRLELGLRGQYLYGVETVPGLYLSRIDYRLNLRGAQGGLWLLDDELRMEMRSLPGGMGINHWSLYRGDELLNELVDLNSHLLYAEQNRLVLRGNAVDRVLFSVEPPTDTPSWEAFVAATAPYEELRRDPLNMRSWLDAFPGDTLVIDGGSVAGLRYTASGFRFELVLEDGANVSGDLLVPGLHELEPGHYVVTYENGAWSHEVARAPRFDVTLEADLLQTFMPGQLRLRVQNLGNLDYRGSVQLWIDSEEVRRWDDVTIGGYLHETIDWSPERSGTLEVFLHIGSEVVPLEPIYVAPSPRVAGREAIALSVFDEVQGGFIGVFLGVVFFSAFAMWLIWRQL